VGTTASVSITGQAGGMGIVASFSAPPTTDGTLRKGTVTVKCNPSVQSAQVTIHNPTGAEGTAAYATTFESSFACGVKGGISGGTVFLIIFFAGIAVYIIAGIVYLGPVKGNRGKEMIPNLSFWMMVPGLIQDGATFTITKIKGLAGKA